MLWQPFSAWAGVFQGCPTKYQHLVLAALADAAVNKYLNMKTICPAQLLIYGTFWTILQALNGRRSEMLNCFMFDQQATLFKKWTRWVVMGRRIDSAGVLLLSFRYLRCYHILKMVSNSSNVFDNKTYRMKCFHLCYKRAHSTICQAGEHHFPCWPELPCKRKKLKTNL